MQLSDSINNVPGAVEGGTAIPPSPRPTDLLVEVGFEFADPTERDPFPIAAALQETVDSLQGRHYRVEPAPDDEPGARGEELVRITEVIGPAWDAVAQHGEQLKAVFETLKPIWRSSSWCWSGATTATGAGTRRDRQPIILPRRRRRRPRGACR